MYARWEPGRGVGVGVPDALFLLPNIPSLVGQRPVTSPPGTARYWPRLKGKVHSCEAGVTTYAPQVKPPLRSWRGGVVLFTHDGVGIV